MSLTKRYIAIRDKHINCTKYMIQRK